VAIRADTQQHQVEDHLVAAQVGGVAGGGIGQGQTLAGRGDAVNAARAFGQVVE
jgi:hypothetical protein